MTKAGKWIKLETLELKHLPRNIPLFPLTNEVREYLVSVALQVLLFFHSYKDTLWPGGAISSSKNTAVPSYSTQVASRMNWHAVHGFNLEFSSLPQENSCNWQPLLQGKKFERVSHYRNTDCTGLSTLRETVTPNRRFLQRILLDVTQSLSQILARHWGDNTPLQTWYQPVNFVLNPPPQTPSTSQRCLETATALTTALLKSSIQKAQCSHQ